MLIAREYLARKFSALFDNIGQRTSFISFFLMSSFASLRESLLFPQSRKGAKEGQERDGISVLHVKYRNSQKTRDKHKNEG